MSERLRIGIVGCGGIANGKHLPSLKAINRADIVAFCDLIPERAEKACAEYGAEGAKTYTDYHRLLEDKSIDVVYVLTPNRMHAQVSIDALNAGKHVMCEKPMAINSAEAKRMLDAAKAMGYRVNEAASTLRSGSARLLAVILPDTSDGLYDDLYASLSRAASENGYATLLRLTANLPGAEYRAIQDVLSARAACVVVVTSLPDPKTSYAPLLQAGVEVVFALRGGFEGCLTAGFERAAAAQAIAARALRDGPAESIAVMTNMVHYPAEAAFRMAFLASVQPGGRTITCVQSISSQYGRQAFSLNR